MNLLLFYLRNYTALQMQNSPYGLRRSPHQTPTAPRSHEQIPMTDMKPLWQKQVSEPISSIHYINTMLLVIVR